MTAATLTRIGNFVGLIIPKEYRTAGFNRGDKVTAEKTDDAIVVRPIKEPTTLQIIRRAKRLEGLMGKHL